MRTLRQFWRFDRTVQLLLLNQLAIMLGFSMLMPYLASYLSTTLGFAAWMVGLVLGLRTFSQQGLSVMGGVLADHCGYKPLIAAGCALRVAGFLLFGFCHTLPGVLGAAILSGLGGACFEPAMRAYLAAESGDQRVAAFALFNICEALGACMGPLLSMALFPNSFRGLCLTASGIFLVLTLLQLRYLPPQGHHKGTTPQPGVYSWREALANRTFVGFAVGMVGYLTLYNQLYLSLPLEVQRLTGHVAGTGVLLTGAALLGVMAQGPMTAYVQTRWRPLQAIALGLALMGGACLPLLATSALLPVHVLQVADATTWSRGLTAAINLSPALVSAMLVVLGTMLVQPFALSLISVLGDHRLLGTYYGCYYLVQGSGAVVGNLMIGTALDAGQRLGFPSLPWLCILSLGVASALRIAALDRKQQTVPVTTLSAEPCTVAASSSTVPSTQKL
jgi:MFS family permease